MLENLFSGFKFFLAHLIDFWWWEAESERPWEAVRGRAPLIGSNRSGTLWHRSLSQWGEHGLSRPLTFGLTRPLIASASHNLSCDLSEPIREHGLPRKIRPHRLRARQCDPRGRLTDFMAKRIASAGRVRSPGVRERPIGLSNLWGRGSPNTASHHKVMWSVWESEHGLSRPHRSDSQICEADLWGRESPWEAMWESDRPLTHTGRSNAFSREISHTAPRIGLSAAVRERPIGLPHGLSRTLTASQIGLSRPHRSDSHGLTDQTLWQIWQIRQIIADRLIRCAINPWFLVLMLWSIHTLLFSSHVAAFFVISITHLYRLRRCFKLWKNWLWIMTKSQPKSNRRIWKTTDLQKKFKNIWWVTKRSSSIIWHFWVNKTVNVFTQVICHNLPFFSS